MSSLYSKSALVCFLGDLAAATAEWMRAGRAIFEAESAIEKISWAWSPELSTALDHAIVTREALAWAPRQSAA